MPFNSKLFKFYTNSHVSRGNELVKNNKHGLFSISYDKGVSYTWWSIKHWTNFSISKVSQEHLGPIRVTMLYGILEHMYKQVLLKAMTIIQASRFILMTCNKIIMMDYTSWVSIHAYVVQNWNHVSILISLDHASCEEQI